MADDAEDDTREVSRWVPSLCLHVKPQTFLLIRIASESGPLVRHRQDGRRGDAEEESECYTAIHRVLDRAGHGADW